VAAVIEKTLISHDNTLRDVILKIRPLFLPPTETKKRRIGFHTNDWHQVEHFVFQELDRVLGRKATGNLECGTPLAESHIG